MTKREYSMEYIIVNDKTNATFRLNEERDNAKYIGFHLDDYFPVEATDGTDTYWSTSFNLLNSDVETLKEEGYIFHSGYYDSIEEALESASLTKV